MNKEQSNQSDTIKHSFSNDIWYCAKKKLVKVILSSLAFRQQMAKISMMNKKRNIRFDRAQQSFLKDIKHFPKNNKQK